MEKAILRLSCPDKPGIVATVTSTLAKENGFIHESAQFGDEETDRFFMRVVFSAPDLAKVKSALENLGMEIELSPAEKKTKTLILVSKQGHCLNDLLHRAATNHLPIEIAGVVSNHPDLEEMVSWYGIPFHHLPVTKESKAEQEGAILKLADEQGVELVVLARYMQILSSEMCQKLSGNAINIHHSFLPSFKGARPYHQAHERGVKRVGATAHYATTDLDEGPIIEQDVVRVTHRDSPADLVRKGRDVERNVLSRAVRAHLEDRILVFENKTVVFD